MDSWYIGILLATVEQQWREIPSEQRPKRVWICSHDPLPPDIVDQITIPLHGGLLLGFVAAHDVSAGIVNQITSPLREVWLLDEWGIRKGDVWAFLRFYTVHIVQPWCARTYRERNQIFGRVHEIGLAAFASYRGTDNIYLETVWGNLHGRGGRYAVDQQGVLKLVGPEWIS